jgi:hypothetical protein
MDMTAVKAIFDERGRDIWAAVKPAATPAAAAGA